MTEPPILDPKSLTNTDRRRKEWVTLPGGRVCIWELTMPDGQWVLDRSLRPREDPRGGRDPVVAGAFEVIASCYDGDGPNAKRLFQEADIALVMGFTHAEFQILDAAIGRVNFLTRDEADELEDFTQATGAPATSE